MDVRLVATFAFVIGCVIAGLLVAEYDLRHIGRK